MSQTKSNVEMSLDDIIKAKRKDKPSTSGGRPGKKSNGILKRGKKIAKQPRKQQQQTKSSNVGRAGAKRVPRRFNNKTGAVGKPTTVATKRLVQKLVKKALARTNVRNVLTAGIPRSIQRPKFRANRVIKKTVIVNPLKLNPRSRVINRRPRVVTQQLMAVRGRGGQLRYNPALQMGAIVRRVNYAPKIVAQPVMIRAAPRRNNFVVQQRMPPRPRQATTTVYQTSSIRDHISQLRTGGAPSRRATIYANNNRQPQPRRQVFQQFSFQPQRRPRQQQQQQQRRNNFPRKQQQQRKNEPFFEPPNFLQRVPVQNVGRRF